MNAFKSKIEQRIEAKKEAIQATGVQHFELSEAEIEDEMERLTKEAEEGCVFNAAKYLYVSHRLARALPHLPISVNVLQFSTPWPNQSLKEDNKMSDNYNANFTFVGQSLSKVLYFVLLGLMSVPEPLQDALIEVVSTSGLGYVVVLFIQVYTFSPFLAFIPIVLVTCIVGLIVYSSKQSSFLSKISVEPTKSSELAIVEEVNEEKHSVRGVDEDSNNDQGEMRGAENVDMSIRDNSFDNYDIVNNAFNDDDNNVDNSESEDEDSNEESDEDSETDDRRCLSMTHFYYFDDDAPKLSALLQKSGSEVRHVVHADLIEEM